MRHNRGIKYSQGIKYKGARAYSDDKQIKKNLFSDCWKGLFVALKINGKTSIFESATIICQNDYPR